VKSSSSKNLSKRDKGEENGGKRMVSGTITHQNSPPSIQTMVPDIFLLPAQHVPYCVDSLILAAVCSADFSNVLST
jgi:hypothetical protein